MSEELAYTDLSSKRGSGSVDNRCECVDQSCNEAHKNRDTRTVQEIPTHPETICEGCGRRNVTWFAPSELWNRVARTTERDPMLCPVCFIQAAERVGITPTAWVVAPEVGSGEQ